MADVELSAFRMDKELVPSFRAEHPDPIFESSDDKEGKITLYYHDNPSQARLPDHNELMEMLDDVEPEEVTQVREPPTSEPEAEVDLSPLDGSIEQIENYLEGVEDPAEVEALLQAEKDGNTRVGAIEVLEAALARLTSSKEE